MNAEIIAVGTEILLGQIANTDAQFISQQLSEFGFNVYYEVTVGDNTERLIKCFKQALDRSDVIITTGGLGPTMDDLTKETICDYFHLKMKTDKYSLDRMKEYFSSTGKTMTENNVKQAMFPEEGIILKNDHGTAPGLLLEINGKTIIILPGPPIELKPMFINEVRPYLLKKVNQKIFSKVLRIFGIGESRVEYMLKDIIEKQTNPTIATYAKLGEVTIRVTARCDMDEDPLKIIGPTEKIIRDRLGDCVYDDNDKELYQVTGNLLMEQDVKIALAESCTGGMLTADLVNLPGISDVLVEGIVTYSNQAKIKLLNVSKKTLDNYGAVSAETAAEMAEGVRKNSGADLGVSVTGIAGPGGGTDTKPVGLVYIGLSDKNGVITKELHLSGDRQKVRHITCLNALDIIRRKLLNKL